MHFHKHAFANTWEKNKMSIMLEQEQSKLTATMIGVHFTSITRNN